MSADLSSLIRKGLSDSCDEAGLPADGTPPPPVRPVPARRSGRWFAPVMAAAAVVVVAAATTLVPHWGRQTEPEAATTAPALPREFAGPSLLAAPVQEAPPGTVAALIGYPELPIIGDLGAGQELAVAVNGRDYRALPSGPGLLSPDGSHLIVGGDGTLDLIDLRTGSTRTYRVGGGDLNPSAFSPNGRLVVYQYEEVGPVFGEGCDSNYGPHTVLIDLATSRRTTLTRDSACRAAFSPDGKQIAVQIGDEIVLMDTTGHPLKRLPAAGTMLESPHAWSPDGRFLAVLMVSTVEQRIGFLAVNKDDRPPRPLSYTNYGVPEGHSSSFEEPQISHFLGWTDPQHVVTFDHLGAGDKDALVRHALTGGAPHVISTYPKGTYYGYVTDIAADLLPQLVAVNGGSPDYGPWPAWLTRTVIGVTAILAALVALILRRRRH